MSADISAEAWTAQPGIAGGAEDWHVLGSDAQCQVSVELKNKGLRRSKPEHWAQMQCYMGWAAWTGPVLAACKDADELYAERVRADPLAFVELVEGRRIIHAAEPPKQINNDPALVGVRSFAIIAPACRRESAPGITLPHLCSSTPLRRRVALRPLVGRDSAGSATMFATAHRFIPSVLLADRSDLTPEGL